MEKITIGIVGLGKVARDQHIPAIRANSAFELVAVAGRNAKVEGLAVFATIDEMLTGCPALDAVAICTPPQAHYEEAQLALQRRKHVLLEKPPCATTAQFDELARLARENACTLFQTWHARHGAAVEAARRWLMPRHIRSAHVVWKEDVRYWHPGQSWIWQAGGFGVLDAGINAVSILTKIVPKPIFVEAAHLFVPSNCEAPIAANVRFRTSSGAPIDAEFDFRHKDRQSCTMLIETDGGTLRLSEHGSALSIEGAAVPSEESAGEYPSLYKRFAELIGQRQSETDYRPLRLVADIFLTARRTATEAFYE